MLTGSVNSLFRENCVPFLQKVGSSLLQISKHELSWLGRLAAFKMVVLPQLLYLFRTMPILVPNTYFHSLQSIVHTFLWQHKRACCVFFSKRIKHRQAVGVGHIVLIDCYITTILTQLKVWFDKPFISIWSKIESDLISGKNLSIYLLLQFIKPQVSTSLSPTILAPSNA